MTDARPNIKARAGIGFVPEGRGIFPNLSVEENLLFAERAGPEGQVEWTPEAIYQMFPRLAERRTDLGQSALRRRAADADDRARAAEQSDRSADR